MNIAKVKYNDIANGLGIRVSVFVSGCRKHCKNCFNPETWDFLYGIPYNSLQREKIFKELDEPMYQGMTILGGEPLEPENAAGVLSLITDCRKQFKNDRDIWLYTGKLYEDLIKDRSDQCQIYRDILKNIDVLVDGPFIQEKANISLAFRGSSNQRIIDMRKTNERSCVVLRQ